MIEERLLTDLVTIRKPVQTFSAGKMPVLEYQTILTDVKVRFEPLSTSEHRVILGNVPKKIFRVFTNPVDIRENYELIRQSDNAKFLVTDVKNFFGHHIELIAEEKKCSE